MDARAPKKWMNTGNVRANLLSILYRCKQNSGKTFSLESLMWIFTLEQSHISIINMSLKSPKLQCNYVSSINKIMVQRGRSQGVEIKSQYTFCLGLFCVKKSFL